ncbi:DUF3800 domain-containing protein [Vagococcus salmoninarum]|uniref:DUF3800 domain-containing protein n=1 Tax=Vagococcus salmoninarum TaxID=2739 RepID=UPI00187EE3EF|nr:DUF3800 domain-containing protein [Vagococcus salmoninarum]MBE9389439.1 DUF3800 domain-containing protein [Vagococcus salmoninarum]
MRLFVDESGSITTSKSLGNRFFVIAFLETEEPYNVIRQFREAKKEYIKRTPACNLVINGEIKGSQMPFGMKKLIFERISQKTDAVFHFKVVDNFNLYNNLLSNVSLSFNYFIYLTVDNIRNLTKSATPKELKMQLDDRNTAVESLNSLQEYLFIKFVIENQKFDSIKTSYRDSQSRDLLQVIDLFANSVYRISRNHGLNLPNDKKNRQLLDICNKGCSHYFPRWSCDLDICH